MENQIKQTGERSDRLKRTTIRLATWTAAWLITVAAASFGPEFLWGSNIAINGLVILLNLGIGIGMIITNIKHLRQQDEMMQKVQLEAMGVSLGVAVVGGISYTLMDITNVIPYDAEISFLIILIGITYLVSVFINMRRYK